MKSLGGSLFPALPAAATTAAAIEEAIEYDDDEEDSPASTIVPSSPVRSRRNSPTRNGGNTEDHDSGSRGNLSYHNDNDRNRDGDNERNTIPPPRTTIPHPSTHKALPNHPGTNETSGPTTPGNLTTIEPTRIPQRTPSNHQTPRTTRVEEGLSGPERNPNSLLNCEKKTTPSPPHAPRMEDRTPPSPTTETSASTPTVSSSKLHPRVAVILGVDRKWYLPLVVCRALSVGPALWWGLRCAFTFLAELLRIRPGNMWREGWVAIVVSSAAADWDVERRFRVTEVALAIMWCCASAYLSYFFMDCMMSRWLLNYSPPAVLIRLLATNGLIAYLTSSVLWLSGASSDPRLLLPAWISITTVQFLPYHTPQHI
ncbi:conserved hypothetical protein [Talaromyces stipitatus ATCC 10500]|uniref:N-glycosylation protein EOS1 n=1 Tax=Talaromyces stipitatus (strain ATCC 10500 / CBS 375.48 / QM 6759 / NRRL 1006) TaxID=441959 RepID=B8MMY2_TALSN|nr:uncharacterized protein TSTA_101680 [Talaromyces stipitatus ATCC 10500]EED13931.1 conserved hypothetical protein [Talaromyces stipitatus ATCC 10500]